MTALAQQQKAMLHSILVGQKNIDATSQVFDKWKMGAISEHVCAGRHASRKVIS